MVSWCQHSIFNFQHSTFNFQHSIFNIQHSIYKVKRRDLAMKHFPESSPRAAVKALLRWIDNCPDLIKALDELNIPYRHKINLTAKQVRTIMEYLGDP